MYIASSITRCVERNGVNLRSIWAAEYQLLFNSLIFNSLIFNPSKSKLMYFILSHENLRVKICGKEVLLVSHETYLGNFIGSDIFDFICMCVRSKE